MPLMGLRAFSFGLAVRPVLPEQNITMAFCGIAIS